MRNGRRRPDLEHRLLLDQGLLDLLDRSMDRAADEISGTLVDGIMGPFAGYRQRLGL